MNHCRHPFMNHCRHPFMNHCSHHCPKSDRTGGNLSENDENLSEIDENSWKNDEKHGNWDPEVVESTRTITTGTPQGPHRVHYHHYPGTTHHPAPRLTSWLHRYHTRLSSGDEFARLLFVSTWWPCNPFMLTAVSYSGVTAVSYSGVTVVFRQNCHF